MLYDTHCHLNLAQFESDLPDVISKAHDHGVKRIIVPGVDLESSRTAVQIANQFEAVYAAIGIHPEAAAGWNDSTRLNLIQMARNEKVVAIGEIGLDDHWKDVPMDIQAKAFRGQLDLAFELGLPVSIHSREAESRVIEELAHRSSQDRKSNGVLHAFGGSLQIAVKAIDLGFTIGIGGHITFKSNSQGRSILQSNGLGAIVLETDAPYLAPVPYRGKRNEPANISVIAEKIAEILEIDVKSVTEATTANADKIFRWRRVE